MLTKLTDLLPASPVRKGGVKGSYTKMAIFLTGCVSPRSEPPPGRAVRLHLNWDSNETVMRLCVSSLATGAIKI